jgi:hypothetical protein
MNMVAIANLTRGTSQCVLTGDLCLHLLVSATESMSSGSSSFLPSSIPPNVSAGSSAIFSLRCSCYGSWSRRLLEVTGAFYIHCYLPAVTPTITTGYQKRILFSVNRHRHHLKLITLFDGRKVLSCGALFIGILLAILAPLPLRARIDLGFGVGGAMPAFASVALPLPGDMIAIAIPALAVISVVLPHDVSTLVAVAATRAAVEQMGEAVAVNRLGDGGWGGGWGGGITAPSFISWLLVPGIVERCC